MTEEKYIPKSESEDETYDCYICREEGLFYSNMDQCEGCKNQIHVLCGKYCKYPHCHDFNCKGECVKNHKYVWHTEREERTDEQTENE